MDTPIFLSVMYRGRHDQEKGLDGSSYCVFYNLLKEPVIQDRISGGENSVVLELRYGSEEFPGGIRIRQIGTNAVIEESADGKFRAFLADKSVKYIGHLLMYALQFKIQEMSERVSHYEGELKQLEDALDSSIDNSETYQLLDFRRKYAECGGMIIAVKEILTRFDKGYFPMQMQNSFVLQGEVMLEFDFLEERYDLIRSTILKDFDTYTSIVNNNINRNARLLSIISLTGVVLNFMFGSLLVAHPVLGVLGGLTVAGLSFGATAVYHVNRRRTLLVQSSKTLDSTPTLPSGSGTPQIAAKSDGKKK